MKNKRILKTKDIIQYLDFYDCGQEEQFVNADCIFTAPSVLTANALSASMHTLDNYSDEDTTFIDQRRFNVEDSQCFTHVSKFYVKFVRRWIEQYVIHSEPKIGCFRYQLKVD